MTTGAPKAHTVPCFAKDKIKVSVGERGSERYTPERCGAGLGSRTSISHTQKHTYRYTYIQNTHICPKETPTQH